MSDFHLFGKPGQPEHPDFVKLSDIILQLDGRTEDPGFDYHEFLGEVVDPDSIVYMARQRVLRMSDQVGIPDRYVPALAAIWLDAFVAGREWGHDGR